MSSLFWKAGLAGLAIVVVVGVGTIYAQSGPDQMHRMQNMHGRMAAGESDQQQQQMPHGGMGGMRGGMQNGMHGRMTQGQGGMHGGMGSHGMMGPQSALSGQPALPGQDAFGAIQDIVQILEADSSTDWSKVNIATLREHLIDMNEVTLRAAANARTRDDGVEFAITGEGRTREAIKRMVPAHVAELAKNGWDAKTEDLPNGVTLIVTSSDPKQVVKLKALGFIGIMVQGRHHQPHHLMMAKGELTAH